MDSSLQQSIGSMKQSDKIIGGILIVSVLSVLGYGFYWILPFLVEMAANTIYFVGELVILGILGMVFLDKNTWRNLYYGWKNISRAMRRAIISSDPIGILDTVVHRYEVKLGEIDDNIVLADAATKRQKNSITEFLKRRDEELNLAKASERQGKPLQVGQHAAAAERWDSSATEMGPMLQTLAGALTCMERARDLCEVRLEDIKNQKLVLSRRLEALQSGQKAVRKIKSFLGSNPDMEMQEMAVEDIERKSTEALAEIDQFMRVITPAMDAQDLKQSAVQIAAMEKFDKYISGVTTAPQLAAGSPTATLSIPSPRTVSLKEKQ